jgi:15-cis-phytoene synthase
MKALFDQVALKCSKLTTNSYSTSFSLGIKFLDKSIHDEIYAIYGFVRFADEIVDTFHEYAKEELLEEFKAETWRSIERKISLNPILNSFQWVVNKYEINPELITSFLDSMSMDLKEQVYDRTLYEKYILGSAEVVGLMCLKVFVNGSEEKYQNLKAPAMSLGAAFQKINFLRDLGQDSNELGRSYFPQLQNQKLNLTTKEELINEIKADFKAAYEGIKQLPLNSRFGVYVAYTYYLKLLEKIAKAPVEKISQNRIRISNFKKMILASKAFFEYKMRLSVFNKEVKLIAPVLILLSLFTAPAFAYSTASDIRKAYIDCDLSKEQAENFLDLVQESDTSTTTNQAYLAAAKMVKAKFGMNPINKMLLFIEGRNELEKLIEKEPNNIELRYIRLAVQKIAPKFLSYRDNINEDRVLLLSHLKEQNQHGDFESNVLRFLKRENLINTKELEQINA